MLDLEKGFEPQRMQRGIAATKEESKDIYPQIRLRPALRGTTPGHVNADEEKQ